MVVLEDNSANHPSSLLFGLVPASLVHGSENNGCLIVLLRVFNPSWCFGLLDNHHLVQSVGLPVALFDLPVFLYIPWWLQRTVAFFGHVLYPVMVAAAVVQRLLGFHCLPCNLWTVLVGGTLRGHGLIVLFHIL